MPSPSIGTPLKDLLARQTREESPFQTGDYTLVGMTNTLGQLGTCQVRQLLSDSATRAQRFKRSEERA